jgi:hypothetical protein
MTESPTEDFEHAEHAEHAAHSGDRFLTVVSVTIAILAVVAATVGSLETLESGDAISDKNESVLIQNRASDTWAYFQAQSIKRNMYEIAAATVPTQADAYGKKSHDYADDSAKTRSEAEALERERDAKLADSTHHEHRHHILTTGVTLLHVAIAVATVSIITRGRRWPWHAALVLGAIGTVVAGGAYLV